MMTIPELIENGHEQLRAGNIAAARIAATEANAHQLSRRERQQLTHLWEEIATATRLPGRDFSHFLVGNRL
jgi:hypothetical protein